MRKINWFTRIFMSWNTLVKHISADNKEILIMQERLSNKEEAIKKLQADEMEFKKREQKHLELIASFNTKMETISAELKASQKTNVNNEKIIAIKDNEMKNLNDQINERQRELKELKNDIHDQLTPLNKIEKTFFGSTGNKGKGELGEMQLKTLLEKSGLEPSLWQENLTVGNKTVEFAIQSGNDDGKWIPIDSKVIEYKVDDNKKPIADDVYKRKVETQVKEVSKYTGNTNTSEYGLLVLQSDSIYLELFETYPTFFKEMIEKHNIYITSPSSFVQMAWSISHIIKIFDRINKDEKIYDEMISMLDTVYKFGNALSVSHEKFNTAMNSHYPAFKNKHIKLTNKLHKEGKIKELPPIK